MQDHTLSYMQNVKWHCSDVCKFYNDSTETVISQPTNPFPHNHDIQSIPRFKSSNHHPCPWRGDEDVVNLVTTLCFCCSWTTDQRMMWLVLNCLDWWMQSLCADKWFASCHCRVDKIFSFLFFLKIPKHYIRVIKKISVLCISAWLCRCSDWSRARTEVCEKFISWGWP